MFVVKQFFLKEVGEIWVINMKQFCWVCMLLDSQQVVLNPLGKELWNVYSKQTSVFV